MGSAEWGAAAAGAFLIIVFLIIVWIVSHEIRKSYQLFSLLADRHGGHLRRFPPAAVFSVHSVPVKVSALQGTIVYHARINLRTDPFLLMIRPLPCSPRLWEWWRRPGLKDIDFDGGQIKSFIVQSTQEAWAREVLTADIREQMGLDLPLIRVEVRRTKVVAMIRLMRLNPESEELCGRAVDVMNRLVARVRESSFSEGCG